jgi:glycoside/pentoside/hexuronide:cation symporter, GPH family
MTSADTVSMKARFGYGVGDFGFNLFFTTASLYLLFYYTDVLGLPPATAGWVFAGALIWDALFDPAMGYIANRTRTRWGRYRPYLLFGGLPLALSWMLMFLPVPLEGSALVLFAASTHIVFRTLYAVVSMPYLALSAVMTNDSHERGVLAGFRMVAAATCALLSAFLTLKLVSILGGGREGFFWVSVLYGTVAAMLFVFTFATVREEAAPVEAEKVTVAQMLSMLRQNRAFWIVCAAMLLGGVGGTLANKALPYYLKYALHREDLIGPVLGVAALSVMVSIPFWTWVMKRRSKAFAWVTGSIIGVVGYALFWMVPQQPVYVIAVMAVLGFGGGAAYFGFWAMMPDTVEYGEWRSGVRSEGGIFGIVSLIQKASLGFAAAGLGEVLQWIGYRANVEQSAATLEGLRIVMIAIPAVLAASAAAIISTYPVGPTLHARLVRALEWRRRRRQRKSPSAV